MTRFLGWALAATVWALAPGRADAWNSIGHQAVAQLAYAELANILCALKQRASDLQTRTAAAEDRAVAVCWIFHLVGDIHQPLHNVAYFSSAPAFVQGDRGGNKFGVRADGRKWNLHAFWDD